MTSAVDQPSREGGQRRVLVIGTGSIGERHVRCFLNTGRASIGVCELREELRTQVVRRYGVRDFRSVEQALAEPWDAAVIATPAHTHIPIAQQLAEHGISTLIEKPLALSLDGIDTLLATAAARSVRLSVAYVLRCHPVIQALKRAVTDETIGPIVQAQFVSGQHFPTYRPAYRETYYVDRRTGGGAIQDALTHLFDLSHTLVGPIHSLASDAEHLRLEDVEVEDTVHVIARQAGCMSVFSLNQHQAPNETTITLVGRHGTLQGQLHAGTVRLMTAPETEWIFETLPSLARDDLFVEQANRFLDFVESGSDNPCPVEDALHSLKASLVTMQQVGRSLVSIDDHEGEP